MSPILAVLGSGPIPDSLLSNLPSVLDEQAGGHTLGSLSVNYQWQSHKSEIDRLIQADPFKALQVISRLVETLFSYAPALKGLQDVHKYTVDTLDSIVFANCPAPQAAAFLLGHTLAMCPLTSEAIPSTVDKILLGGAPGLAICVILGVRRADITLFETHLPTLLRQIQMTAFQSNVGPMSRFESTDTSIPQDALKQAMKLYHPDESGKSQCILKTTHTVFAAALRLCNHHEGGLQWACFIICNTPMLLRNDLRKHYSQTCDAGPILESLLSAPVSSPAEVCAALPILCTWETALFCADDSIERIVRYMVAVNPEHSFDGLGHLACVVLERWTIAQRLLSRLLSALGPITLDTMIAYLRCPASLLLRDVRLLDMIASLLPNLKKRIIQVLVDAIGDATSRGGDAAVLSALTVFPLEDRYLAQRTQELVLWSLDESRDQSQVLLALQLAIDSRIATPITMRAITFKAANLLLADDPHIVHMALSALSNPVLASTLDEKSCQMILLALHQSLEPSIQVVAAKLLTHLSSGHRAIVQPLAWAHIRQSLSLMDFLQTIDPTRSIVEACIISNLLPALPASVRAKYAAPVEHLILLGLERAHDSPILSLLFQGLANLARLGSWQTTKQSQLAIDLLDMSQEIPKDSQHAALNAIARLLAAPQNRGDLYEMLLRVHSTFRKTSHIDADSKALASSIYGHLGTIERNPVISRDSKAAINRESAIYNRKMKLQSQVAEARDKSGAGRHVNWLVSKALLDGTLSEENLEAITGLGILQPSAMPNLVPDLPSLIMREIHAALDRHTTPRTMVICLSSSLHASSGWLQQHWVETADLLGRCVAEGEVLSVFKALDVVLQACN